MMKNIFLTASLLLIIVNSINAQDEDEALYTRAGFKFGLNYANISGDVKDTDARMRMHLGAVIEFPVTRRFFVQAEVLYSAQGYKIEESGVENKISLNYLMLPVITKFYLTDKFSLETGPQLATLANATESKEEDSSNEFFDSFSDFDFSWSFGGGYKLESGLFFQARYNLGLTNINNLDTTDSFKHSVAQFSIGYLFKTKNNRRQNDNF
ncbi:porin family protein [Aquimarina sediminis]|uniref:porin family protein n=1 Tax=Aquimarina sediminis TaxID=2070536 RepID=UPI000CA02013|nr:porin family protein [Aquimarina sediminis]